MNVFKSVIKSKILHLGGHKNKYWSKLQKGLLPLYYWLSGQFNLFSSALEEEPNMMLYLLEIGSGLL